MEDSNKDVEAGFEEISIDGSSSSSSESPQTDVDESILRNRCHLTILHYFLTYPRWSLSLFLLLATLSLPMPYTMHDAVSKPWTAMNLLASRESSLYFDCVQNAFAYADRKMNETYITELQRSKDLQLLNAEKVAGRKVIVYDEIQQKLTTARRALRTYQEFTLLPINNDTTTCSEADRNNLTRLVGYDYFEAEEQVNRIVDGLVSQSIASTKLLAEYAVNRSKYDYMYFVGLKVNATISGLQSFSAPSVDLALDTDALDRLVDLIQAFIDAIRNAQIRITLLEARMTEFFESLQLFYVNYIDIYGRLKLAADFVRDFLPNGISVPDFLDIRGVPTAQFLAPQTFELVFFDTPMPDIDDLLNGYIRELATLLAELIVDLAEEASEQLRDALQELYELVKELLTLEDYDPPKFIGSRANVTAVEKEVEILEEISDESKRGIDSSLSSYEKVRPETIRIERTAPTIGGSGNFSDGDARTFDYLEPRFPSFSIPDVLYAIFAFIMSYQFVIEAAIQCVRFYKLKRKYERNASPDLPEVSYVTESCDQDAKTSTFTTLQVALFKHFVTPWMALGLVLLPFALVALTLWFPHVKASCIDSNYGTIVARNILTPILVNRASVHGNTLHIQAEFHCRKKQRQLCEASYVESDQNQVSMQFELDSIESSFQELNATNQVLAKCLLVDLLDDSFHQACCGLEGYTNCSGPGDPLTCPIDRSTDRPTAFRPLSTYLSSGLLSEPAVELHDAHFNCSVFEGICDIDPCGGVDRDLLQDMAIAADCRAETFFLRSCILILVAIYHAVVVNLCTSLIFSGIKHVFWRKLKPEGIKLRTHVNENGDLVKGGERSERIERIARAMRNFERIGYLQLYMGLAVLIFWFISFFILRKLLSDFA